GIGSTRLADFQTQQYVWTQAVLRVYRVDKVSRNLPGQQIRRMIALLPGVRIESQAFGGQKGKLCPATGGAHRVKVVLVEKVEPLAESAYARSVTAMKVGSCDP